MDATRPLIALLFLLGFQPSVSHPVNLSPAKELASMEDLLERLEEKIALMEDLQGGPEFEDVETPREDGVRFSESDNGQPMMEPRIDAVPFTSDRTSLIKRMRGFQAAKSMRESGCFGRRLDRIGSISGMGCRGSRRN